MQQKLRARILDYALARKHEQKWKVYLYALMYGAGVATLSMLGKENKDRLNARWKEEAYTAAAHDALQLLNHTPFLDRFFRSVGFADGGTLPKGAPCIVGERPCEYIIKR